MKRTLALSTLTAFLLLGTTAIQADSAKTENEGVAKSSHLIQKPQKKKNSVGKEIIEQNKLIKKGPEEVSNGLKQTLTAIKAIQKDDIEKAKQSLKEAHKSFETALKEDPKMKLIPIAGEMQVKQLESTPDQIKDAVKMAKEALDKNHLQEARAILAPLEDDIVVATQYIPMDLYPKAADLALKALEKNNKAAAANILIDGLSTFVTVRVVMPIPLIEAQELILDASKLDKSKKEEAKKLLDAAKVELEKATLLGYTDKHSDEYKELTKQIDAIQKEMKGKNVVEKLYDKLKASFKKLIGETRSESFTDSVEKAEAKALENPDSVKGKAEAEKKVEEVTKKESEAAKKVSPEFEKEVQKDLKDTVK